MRILFILFLAIFNLSFCLSQEDTIQESNFNLQTELATRYPWRGFPGAKSPHALPVFEYSKNNFLAGISGDFSLGDKYYEEIDLYLSYTVKNITLTVADYYMPSNDSLFKGMWVYDKRSTNHVFDAMIQVDGPEKFPFYALFSAIIYFEKDHDKVKNKIAPYAEAGYFFTCGKYTFKTFCGANLKEGFYSDSKGIVNAGFMTEAPITINKNFHIPFRLYFINNLVNRDAYLAASIIIKVM